MRGEDREREREEEEEEEEEEEGVFHVHVMIESLGILFGLLSLSRCS